MEPTSQQGFIEIIQKDGEWTAEEVKKLKKQAYLVRYLQDQDKPMAQFRATVELIDAIRRFDRGSTRLMCAAIALAVLATVISACQLIVALLPPH